MIRIDIEGAAKPKGLCSNAVHTKHGLFGLTNHTGGSHSESGFGGVPGLFSSQPWTKLIRKLLTIRQTEAARLQASQIMNVAQPAVPCAFPV